MKYRSIIRAVSILAGVAAISVLLTDSAPAQGRNPDLSAIGDTRASWREAADPVLDFEELELGLVGPLNPYASAEIYLAIHGTEGIEVEEAKLMLDRYLPAGLGLTAGRFLLDLGQLNPLHQHAYPFVERPLMYAEFFGGDGALDSGVRLDWLAPTEGVTVRATLGAVRGDVFLGEHEHGGGTPHPEETVEPEPRLGASGRVDLFAEPSKDFSFLLGVSTLRGQHDPAESAIATWVEADVKARWDLGPSRALVVNAETVFGALEATDETPASDPNGLFVSADLRTSRRWNFGGFVESATGRLDDGQRTNRYGAFVGLALMEESTVFRMVGRVLDPETGGTTADVVVQALFALGPHRPHRY